MNIRNTNFHEGVKKQLDLKAEEEPEDIPYVTQVFPELTRISASTSLDATRGDFYITLIIAGYTIANTQTGSQLALGYYKNGTYLSLPLLQVINTVVNGEPMGAFANISIPFVVPFRVDRGTALNMISTGTFTDDHIEIFGYYQR